MSDRLRELAARRAALGERSAMLRGTLVADCGGLSRRLRVGDLLVAAARSGAARALLGAVAALVVVGRPRRVLSLALKALAFWPLVSALLPKVRSMFTEPEASA